MKKLENTPTNKIIVSGLFAGAGALLVLNLAKSESNKIPYVITGAILGSMIGFGLSDLFIQKPELSNEKDTSSDKINFSGDELQDQIVKTTENSVFSGGRYNRDRNKGNVRSARLISENPKKIYATRTRNFGLSNFAKKF